MPFVKKERNSHIAASLFQGTSVSIAKDGKLHLYIGSALGSDSIVKTYIWEEVAIYAWVQEVEQLYSIAVCQPQSTFAVFTHAWAGKQMDLCFPDYP